MSTGCVSTRPFFFVQEILQLTLLHIFSGKFSPASPHVREQISLAKTYYMHKNFSPVITCSNLSGKKVAREYRPARCTSTKLPENIAPADLRCSAFNKSLTRYIWNTFIHNVILHSNQNNLLCSKFTKQSSTAYLFGKEQFSLFGVHA